MLIFRLFESGAEPRGSPENRGATHKVPGDAAGGPAVRT
jgi:hypothetical protein